jgi:hypothetical protein
LKDFVEFLILIEDLSLVEERIMTHDFDLFRSDVSGDGREIEDSMLAKILRKFNEFCHRQ